MKLLKLNNFPWYKDSLNENIILFPLFIHVWTVDQKDDNNRNK